VVINAPQRRHGAIAAAVVGITGLSVVSTAGADSRVKADNADALNLPTSWVTAVPTAADIAVWNSTVTGANTVALGANLTFGGLQIVNPGGAVTLAAGNTLTLGAGGIDMSAATQNLTLNAGVSTAAGTSQQWSVASGRQLTVGGALARGANSTLNFDLTAGGTASVTSATPSTLFTDGFATFNKTDFAAVDGTGNVVAGSAVLAYTANPNTGGALPSISGTFEVLDVVNSNTNAISAFRLSNTMSIGTGIRFNTAHASGQDWVVDINTRNLNVGNASVLVTQNVGTSDVIFNTGTGNIRMGTNQDLMLHQHNTLGDLIFNGQITQSAGAGSRVIKTGAGKVVLASNTNGYGGGTFINEGVVQIGNGGTTGNAGSGGVTVASGATLQFNRSDAHTFTNLIGGAGKVVVENVATGVTSLTGANFYTGGTDLISGTLNINGIFALGGGNYGGVRFNGGTLQWANPFTGLNGSADVSVNTASATPGVTINAGGATFDTNGNNIVFASPIGNGGTGGVTKVGAGTLTLTGTQAYSGTTTVNGGTLRINGSLGAVVVNNGGAFGSSGGNSTVTSLTLGSAGTDAMTILANDGTGIKTINVTGTNAFVVNGNTVFDLGTTGLTVGSYTLIDYDGTIGGLGIGGLSILLPPRVIANLFDDVGNSSVDVDINGIDKPYWTGSVNGSWDINTTSNWKEVTSGNTTTYLQPAAPGDHVLFNDDATGTTAITIATPVAPASVTVNNSTDAYSFAGAGITGSTGLLKQGSGSLTLTNAGNTYTGGTGIQGGTLALAAGTTLPSVGAIAVSGGATLDLGTNAQTTSGAVTLDGGSINNGTLTASSVTASSGNIGAGLAGATVLTKTGTGTLTLSGVNTHAGATTIAAGSLVLTGSSTNAGGTTIATGATLEVGDGTTTGTISGNISNSGTLEFDNPTNTTYTGSTTGGSGTVIKNGPGSLEVVGNIDGNVTVNAGNISITGSGNNSRLARFGTLTVNTGGTVTANGINALGLSTSTNPPAIVLAGGTVNSGSGADTAIYSVTFSGGSLGGPGSITLRDNYTATAGTSSSIDTAFINSANKPNFNVGTGATLTVSGQLLGSDGMEKAGDGTMILTNASNTHTGGTEVQQGTLILAGGHTANANYTVSTGATLQVASTGTLAAGNIGNAGTLSSGGTTTVASLTGSGTTNVTGGTLASVGGIRQGGLSISNNAVVSVPQSNPAPQGDDAVTSMINTLSIANDGAPIDPSTFRAYSGTLDLVNNDLVIRGGTIAEIQDMVRAGRVELGGSGKGITSSESQTGVYAGVTTLGVIQNDDGFGNPIYTDWNGFTGLTTSDILLKYTWYGDADLSGIVDDFDFALLDAGFTGGGTGWFYGDFDLNGAVDDFDFALLDAGFTGGGAVTHLPEPASLSLVALAAGGLLRRRRRVA
jgi:fibronectin-binding autotransporter adhesin